LNASGHGQLTGTLWAIVIASVVAFLAVEALVAVYAWRHPGAGRRHGLLAMAWTGTPAVILLALVGWSSQVLGSDVRNVPSDPDLTIQVSGKMFVWQIRYVTPDGKSVESLNQLHLPLGKTAKIELSSDDVTHGFWIPQFRIKEIAVPGATTDLWMRPMESGDFNIVCAELCGNSHYAMRGFVHVESQADFDAWLAQQ
jgi:cytochrome c oxidase subunit 2